MLSVTDFKKYDSIFNKTEHNNDCEVYTPGLWERPKNTEKPKVLKEQRNSNQWKYMGKNSTKEE